MEGEKSSEVLAFLDAEVWTSEQRERIRDRFQVWRDEFPNPEPWEVDLAITLVVMMEDE